MVSHCVLNQNSVVNGLERAPAAFSIMHELISREIGIIQLPCPELIYASLDRSPLEYNDYNTPRYREACHNLLLPYIKMLIDYATHNYSFLGVIGIHESPSCSITLQRGVFMEELFNMCLYSNIPLSFIEIPPSYCNNIKNDVFQKALIDMITK